MQDPQDWAAGLGVVALAAACCLLPLLILGGLSVASGIAWGRAGLMLAGTAALVIVVVRAADVARSRTRSRAKMRNKRLSRWGTRP